MESHDYLKKQINQATKELKQLIASVNKKTKLESVIKKVELVNYGLMELINMNLEEINNSPIEHFISSITIDNKLDNHNLSLLAELFYDTGLLLIKQSEKEQAKRLFNRALHIYQYLLKAEDDFTYDRHIKIKKLKEILLQ